MESTDFDQSTNIKADPTKYGFLKSLKISEDVARRLSLHLDNITAGNDTVYLSAIAKEHTPEFILSEVDKIFENGKSKLSNKLVAIEFSNRSKYGPRSIAKPWSQRLGDVKAYFENASVESSVIDNAKATGSLRSISMTKASDYIKPNTNSGLPYYTKKKNLLEKVKIKYDEILSEEYPCILFTRTQEGNKTRTVWGYPVADTLREMTVYTPLLNYQKRLSWRTSLLGPAKVDDKLSALFSKASVLDNYSFISIDFSSFDSSVSNSLITRSFDYIKGLFQRSDHALIDVIKEIFNTIGIVTPSGIMTGKHGVPSGSTFTNEVDSIVQYLCAVNSGCKLIDYEIQGDDGLYLIPNHDIERLEHAFIENGLKVNVEKSDRSPDYCVFLQRLYDKQYFRDGFVGGIYSIYRAIGRIVYQERYSNFEDFDLNGVDYYSIRTITILENVKYHPLFEDLVKLVYSLDKYKLKFSSKSINDYAKMINNGSGTGGFLYNQFGDKVEGINNFETVKLIRLIEKGG